MTFSVGMLISPKCRPRPIDSMRRSSVVRTLFSWPEYVLTTYHFFKGKTPRLRKDKAREPAEEEVPSRHVGRERPHDEGHDRTALAQPPPPPRATPPPH